MGMGQGGDMGMCNPNMGPGGQGDFQDCSNGQFGNSGANTHINDGMMGGGMMDPPQQDFMDMGLSGDCCPPPINMSETNKGPGLQRHRYPSQRGPPRHMRPMGPRTPRSPPPHLIRPPQSALIPAFLLVKSPILKMIPLKST